LGIVIWTIFAIERFQTREEDASSDALFDRSPIEIDPRLRLTPDKRIDADQKIYKIET